MLFDLVKLFMRARQIDSAGLRYGADNSTAVPECRARTKQL